MSCDMTLPKGTLETGQQNVWPLFQRVGTQQLDSSAVPFWVGFNTRVYHPIRGRYFLQALAKSPSRMSCWALFHFA
jgi:hypothetical protein